MFQVIIFFHIAGTIALFAAWISEYVQIYILSRIVPAADGNDFSWKIMKLSSRYSMLAMLVTLATGIGLMVIYHARTAWMEVPMALLLLITITGIVLQQKSKGISTNSRLSLLLFSIRIRIALGTGIISLMVFKPFTAGPAILVAAIFLIAGIGWAFLSKRKIRR